MMTALFTDDEREFYRYAMGYTSQIDGKVGRVLQKATDEVDAQFSEPVATVETPGPKHEF